MTKRDNCQEDGFGLLVIKRNKNKYQSDTDWYVIYIPLDKENREGTWPSWLEWGNISKCSPLHPADASDSRVNQLNSIFTRGLDWKFGGILEFLHEVLFKVKMLNFRSTGFDKTNTTITFTEKESHNFGTDRLHGRELKYGELNRISFKTFFARFQAQKILYQGQMIIFC